MVNAEWQVRLLDPKGAACVWRDRDTGAGGRGTLADAAAAVGGCRVQLILPGASVLLTRVAVPADHRGRARAAIPWAIEDRLAEDVERLHFALGERGSDGAWSVAVIARDVLEVCLQACRDAGLDPVAVTPAQLALPLPGEGEWSTLEEADQVTVRAGPETGFACEPAMLEVVMATLDPPTGLRRHGTETVEWPGSCAPADGALEPEPFADAAIDLLQGDFARTANTGAGMRRWRGPAVIGVAALVAAGVHAGMSWHALADREQALRGELQAIYQQMFPGAGEVADPRARMAARLREREQAAENVGGTLAGRLARVGPVIDGAANTRLAGLTWRGGTLEITVDVADIQSLDRIQQAIEERGMTASVENIDRGERTTEGRLRIREAS